MKWPRRVRLLGVLLALATAQGLAILVYLKVDAGRRTQEDPTFRYERLSRKPGPDLALVGVDGSSRQLTQLRGRAVLLHFWATWCPPCREELPGLLELGRDLAKEGRLHVVAVSLDSDWETVRDFFGGHVPREIVRDHMGSATDAYDLSTLPDTYLLAADGSTRVRFGGARNWRTKLARDVLLEQSRADNE